MSVDPIHSPTSYVPDQGIESGSTKAQQTYFADVAPFYVTVAKGIVSCANSVEGIDLTKCGLNKSLSAMLLCFLFRNKYDERNMSTLHYALDMYYELDMQRARHAPATAEARPHI